LFISVGVVLFSSARIGFFYFPLGCGRYPINSFQNMSIN